jgi:hypothetical protein
MNQRHTFSLSPLAVAIIVLPISSASPQEREVKPSPLILVDHVERPIEN